MDLKVFIRTTGERKLDKSIEEELKGNYTLLIDKEHKPIDSFIEQLKTISDYDAILLEDDVILCKDFLNEVNKVISKWKGLVINFFTTPHKYFTTYLALGLFSYNQCTFYPKGVAKQIAEVMEKIKKPSNQYDTLVNLAMHELNLYHVKHRPCLVQHIDNDTLIQKTNVGNRRCIWFKDYLDELGIDIKKAYTKENQVKLTELMNQKFKERKN